MVKVDFSSEYCSPVSARQCGDSLFEKLRPQPGGRQHNYSGLTPGQQFAEQRLGTVELRGRRVWRNAQTPCNFSVRQFFNDSHSEHLPVAFGKFFHQFHQFVTRRQRGGVGCFVKGRQQVGRQVGQRQ